MDFRDYPGFNEEETAYAEEQYANEIGRASCRERVSTLV